MGKNKKQNAYPVAKNTNTLVSSCDALKYKNNSAQTEPKKYIF